MNKPDRDELITWLLGFLVGIGLSSAIWMICVRRIKLDAIEHGAAKYVCNEKTGAVEFRRREKPCQE